VEEHDGAGPKEVQPLVPQKSSNQIHLIANGRRRGRRSRRRRRGRRRRRRRKGRRESKRIRGVARTLLKAGGSHEAEELGPPLPPGVTRRCLLLRIRSDSGGGSQWMPNILSPQAHNSGMKAGTRPKVPMPSRICSIPSTVFIFLAFMSP